MFLYKNNRFSIYFGDSSQSITLDEVAQQKETQALRNIADQMNISQLVFLHQNHGVQGTVIYSSDTQSQFFQQSGDFLITQKKECGIGVLTADCLPIVLYNPTAHVGGIIHAGWKGSAAGVFSITIKEMIIKCGASADAMQLFFGPAAGSCCYEVQQDFVDRFLSYQECQSAFIKKNDKIYFDSVLFTSIIARSLGIKPKNIYTTYNVCTICDTSYCSFRREKEKSSRQVTLISLY